MSHAYWIGIRESWIVRFDEKRITSNENYVEWKEEEQSNDHIRHIQGTSNCVNGKKCGLESHFDRNRQVQFIKSLIPK